MVENNSPLLLLLLEQTQGRDIWNLLQRAYDQKHWQKRDILESAASNCLISLQVYVRLHL